MLNNNKINLQIFQYNKQINLNKVLKINYLSKLLLMKNKMHLHNQAIFFHKNKLIPLIQKQLISNHMLHNIKGIPLMLMII